MQPPTAVLQEVLAVRIHLDDCDEHNGALKVVPRTVSGRSQSNPPAVSLRTPSLADRRIPFLRASRIGLGYQRFAQCPITGSIEFAAATMVAATSSGLDNIAT